ncbi:hypothetical protein GCM10023091_19660 [Ravibacter arvi]|uniref:YMGG-like Gly-zipper domain-containing protein n=1 Tax=Ravibacter arvi TaxID=2051041 RepID=A0ABP8LZJ5_9BACT
MKIVVSLCIAGGVMAACHSNTGKEAELLSAKQATIDSMKIEMAKMAVIDSMRTVMAEREAQRNIEEPDRHNGEENRQDVAVVNTPSQPARRKWNHTAKGAVVGAGTGAVTGAIINKNRAEGAIVGSLIGAGVGAGTGAIVDAQKRKKEGK